VENGEEEIFPDPMSAGIADGWRSSAVKALQRQFAPTQTNRRSIRTPLSDRLGWRAARLARAPHDPFNQQPQRENKL